MKKIMILGVTGMAGHVVFDYFNKIGKYDLYNVSFRIPYNDSTMICDVTNESQITEIIDNIRPDVVINCIGVLIQGSNNNPKNAIFINSYLPHLLSNTVSKYGGKLIHLSTDCVFSGKLGGYKENDYRDADDLYGRSKAIGEVFDHANLTIRTSIIGPELKKVGEGLLNWVLRQTNQIIGFTRANWSGITTYELAKFIEFSIENNITGLVHATNNEKITKFELINLILDKSSNSDVKLVGDDTKVVDKSLVNTRKDFSYIFPTYKEMIDDMFLHTF